MNDKVLSTNIATTSLNETPNNATLVTQIDMLHNKALEFDRKCSTRHALSPTSKILSKNINLLEDWPTMIDTNACQEMDDHRVQKKLLKCKIKADLLNAQVTFIDIKLKIDTKRLELLYEENDDGRENQNKGRDKLNKVVSNLTNIVVKHVEKSIAP